MKRICCLAALIGLNFLSVPARAVFPDQPGPEFKSVGMIGKTVAGFFKMAGSGVAISPDWVIGVSHVGGDAFVQGGLSYPILKKTFFKAGGGDPADLALFHLAKPVPVFSPILPAPFAGAAGIALKGEKVYLTGFGKTARLRSDGLGWQPVEGSQGTLRVAPNIIDFEEVNRYDLGKGEDHKWRSSHCLAYDIDSPSDPSQSTLGGPAINGEGGIADKDSGGGWFVKRNGKAMLVAISCTVGRVSASKPTAYCYGGVGFAVHLAPYMGWIRSVTGLKH